MTASLQVAAFAAVAARGISLEVYPSADFLLIEANPEHADKLRATGENMEKWAVSFKIHELGRNPALFPDLVRALTRRSSKTRLLPRT